VNWGRRRTERLFEDRLTSTLIAETEAFLKGTFVLACMRQNIRVPVWALINTICHGQIAQVHIAASNDANWFDTELPLDWNGASRTLARELDILVRNDRELLRQIQQSVLVPLELELIVQDEINLDPAMVVDLTRAALRSTIS